MEESVADAYGQLDVNNDLHVQLPSAVCWFKQHCACFNTGCEYYNFKHNRRFTVVDLGGERGVHLHPPLAASSVFLRT